MKKLLPCLIVFNLFLFAAQSVSAQTYQTAFGLKFGGYENGISAKYFSTKDISLEGVLGFRSHGIVFTGLYEINQTAFDLAELKFYYGAGAHIGSISSSYQRIGSSSQDYNGNSLLLGADAVVGLEYVIPKSPIAISLDLNPRIELASGPFFDLAPGLGIKYTL
ncbi:hypothetical protein BEL04_19775 [Mucilaginibacter sp. PPCGB 2223]|uniref:hypothetical protein n=1 Tax=Mucilaginibacter sp. PPCGB 2223 TaxID=1886027 RepID=UPI000826E809|nr:hypothetical protein [Mucilaginibacter sp. PPCGB 2223]OCX50961.1 hypothetical protein BEL04_19775 [Mucilaginibacter sp. PPCGB 2223]